MSRREAEARQLAGVALSRMSNGRDPRAADDAALERRVADMQAEERRRYPAEYQGEPTPPVSGQKLFRILNAQQIAALPDPEAIIEGMIFKNTLVAVVATRGSFKSFLALDWALCIGSGIPWHGRRVDPGWALYIAAEGAFGIKRRIAAWQSANNREGLLGAHFVPERVTISDAGQVHQLLNQVMNSFEAMPTVIIVDTLARTFRGNENAQEDMSAYVAGCDYLREETGATVIILHHMGWNADRSRGSTVLPDAIDTEITLTRDGERVTLKCTKQKDAEEFDDIELEAVPKGESLVLLTVGHDDGRLTKNQRTCLTTVQLGGGDAPKKSGEWEDESGLKRSSFHHARSVLLQRGYVESRGKGYRITDKGRAALGPMSNGGPIEVQRPPVNDVQSSGGVYTPDIGLDLEHSTGRAAWRDDS